MGLTRCYKTEVFYIYCLLTTSQNILQSECREDEQKKLDRQCKRRLQGNSQKQFTNFTNFFKFVKFRRVGKTWDSHFQNPRKTRNPGFDKKAPGLQALTAL